MIVFQKYYYLLTVKPTQKNSITSHFVSQKAKVINSLLKLVNKIKDWAVVEKAIAN